MHAPFGFTLTVRRIGTNGYGETEVLEEYDIPGCIFAPGTASEDNNQRSQVFRSASIYLPARSRRVDPSSKLVIPAAVTGDDQATEWEAEGPSAAWPNPFTGWNPGSELVVRRVTG